MELKVLHEKLSGLQLRACGTRRIPDVTTGFVSRQVHLNEISRFASILEGLRSQRGATCICRPRRTKSTGIQGWLKVLFVVLALVVSTLADSVI